MGVNVVSWVIGNLNITQESVWRGSGLIGNISEFKPDARG